MTRRITVTTGTRAEYGILRPLLYEIQSNKKLELFLIVSGMHLSKKHGYTINEIKNDGFKISAKIPMIPKGDSNFDMAKSLAIGLTKFADTFKKIKPDVNLVLGDRDEALASSLAASHMNIPNAHIHGGDKTRAGIDEYNRHAITKISNIHFAATKKSKKRIIKMGENPKFVFFTGSPSIDEVLQNKITSRKQLFEKYDLKITGDEVILLYHPVTTQAEKSANEIQNILQAISKLKKTTIAIMPNSDAGNKSIFYYLTLYEKNFKFIKVFKSLPRSDFLGLMKYCGVLVGNSSSGMIEGSYFDISVVNIGQRQENRERGKNVIDVSNDSQDIILRALKKALKMKKKQFKKEYLYGDGKASKKIVKILEQINTEKHLINKQITY